MAQVPLTSKILTVASTTDTTEKKSSLANSSAEYYTMQDIVDTAKQNKGYKLYIAEISQTGTDDPIVNVLINDLSGEVVWTRGLAAGEYVGTLADAFTGKVQIIPPTDSFGTVDATSNRYAAGKVDNDSIYLVSYTVDKTTGVITNTDDSLFVDYSFIEVRVFE